MGTKKNYVNIEERRNESLFFLATREKKLPKFPWFLNLFIHLLRSFFSFQTISSHNEKIFYANVWLYL